MKVRQTACAHPWNVLGFEICPGVSRKPRRVLVKLVFFSEMTLYDRCLCCFFNYFLFLLLL